MASIAQAADEAALEAAFDRAAGLDGAAYVVARDMLQGQGEAVVPLLEKKARSNDWREWSPAQAILLRLEKPAVAGRWRFALTYWNSRLAARDDGRLVATLDGDPGPLAKKQGVTLDGKEIALPPEALPAILDVMREFADGREENVFDRALTALMHHADARTDEPLIYFSTVSWRREAEVVQALAGIGRPALPALHEAVRRGDDEDWYVRRRARMAARAVGLIGDPSSAPVLVEMLDRLAWDESIPVYCQAIRRIGPKDGPQVLFAQLLGAARGWPGRKLLSNSSSRSCYSPIRHELLAFGDAAADVLAKHQTNDQPAQTRAIAAGLAYELGHGEQLRALYEEAGQQAATNEGLYWQRPREEQEVDFVELGRSRVWPPRDPRYGLRVSVDLPAPLLIEQAAVWPNEQTLRPLGNLKGNNLAFDVLAWLLTDESRSRFRQPGAILAIAEVGGAEAIDVYRRRLQLATTLDIDTIIEALVLIADPRGAAILEEIIAREGTSREFTYPTYIQSAAMARTVLPVLKDQPGRMAELLHVEQPSLRLAVARSLARRGDARAVPVLFEAAVVPPPVRGADDVITSPYTASPAVHRQARDAIVGIGEAAVPAIREAAPRSEAKYAPLLAEALVLRINRPALVEAFERAGRIRHPGFQKHTGPDVADFEAAGARVAELVGREAVPLLEAAIVWHSDGVRPGVAAFALAHFSEDRSLEVLVAHPLTIGWARGESLTAAALRPFGEKGIAAAKNVPVADPGRERFGRRVGRHRAATEALAAAGQEQGIDNILAGLKLAADGHIDSAKTNTYLRLATKYTDKRLMPAVVAAVNNQGEEVAGPALDVLVAYADPQIVPVCMRYLGADRASTAGNALLGLALVKGDEVTDFLLKQLDTSADTDQRARIIRALPDLRADSTGSSLVQRAKLSQDVLRERQPKIRRALVDLVKGEDDRLAAEAAAALAEFCKGRKDSEVAEVLTAWLLRQAEPPRRVVEYVVWTGEPFVAPALHEMYLKEPLKRASLARHLATLRYSKAVDDVVAAVDERLAKGETNWGIPEIDVLVDFGQAGRERLLRLTETHHDLNFRVQSLSTLTSRGLGPAFDPAAELFRELSINGLWDPRIRPLRYRRRSETYQSHMFALAQALIARDPAKGYRLVTEACLTVADAGVRDALASQLRRLVEQKPELETQQIPVPPSPFPDVKPAEVQGELPLLAACPLWLEAVKKSGSNGPPADVRDQIIAAGEDSLQIGIELFYPWPVPTEEEIAAALRDLTSENATRRRQATALLAVRPYPAKLLDDALAAAEGERLRRGLAIRHWRRQGGRILDADPRLRRAFTQWLLRDWPIDQMRTFTLARLDRLATIDQEAYIWTEKPLYPLLATLVYSPQPEHRVLLEKFASKARPKAAEVARYLLRDGFRGLHPYYRVNDRWGRMLPKK